VRFLHLRSFPTRLSSDLSLVLARCDNESWSLFPSFYDGVCGSCHVLFSRRRYFRVCPSLRRRYKSRDPLELASKHLVERKWRRRSEERRVGKEWKKVRAG